MEITVDGQTYSYNENNRIGSGGFFDVYRRVEPDSNMAIKILKDHVAGYAPGCEAGYRRQRLLNASGLFPKIEAFGRVDISGRETFVVVEEYIQGTTLTEYIGKLGTDKYINVFKKIAYALHILHAEGIIHRDCHSGNIILDCEQNVRVLDFNTATSEGYGHTMKHSPGVVIWGPFKDPSAPTHTDFTKKSDIYALGIVMAEQILGKKANALLDTPYNDNANLIKRLHSISKSNSELIYLVDLVVAMIQIQPSNRPDSAAILQTLETGKFRVRRSRVDRITGRERSFGFIRLGADRLLEVFIRSRDIQPLRLPARALLQLMVLNRRGTHNESMHMEESMHMLVTPKRFIKSDKIIMFAQVNLPNFPGVFHEFIRSVESTGDYRFFGFTATRGFRHRPGTIVQITIGQDKKLANDISSYLDPLARHLRSCIYDHVRVFLFSSKREGDWEEWANTTDFEGAVEVSATLTEAFHGRFVGRHYANGYLGSTEYVDHSHERYVVIRDFRIVSLVPDYFSFLKEGHFHPVRVVPDGQHRDLVIQFLDSPDLTLYRLRTHCLMPIEESPNFIGKFVKTLSGLLADSSANVSWNIDAFEINDGEIGQLSGESMYSVHVSVHISAKINDSKYLNGFRDRFECRVRDYLHKINGRSIEVFLSPIFGDESYCSPDHLLRFAS